MSLGTRGRVPQAEYVVPVERPFRLDLTANVLRRLSSNVIDLFGPDGVYRRVLTTPRGYVDVAVSQRGDELHAVLRGPQAAHASVLELLLRMLGTGVDLRPFYRSARTVPWLGPLVERMRGVRPPRYPTLWEACVNAVTFQQVSLFAAAAIMSRFVAALGTRVERGADVFTAFPEAVDVAAAGAEPLRAAGMSAAKATALLGIAEALASGALDVAALERTPSAGAALALAGLRGIGPWTAAVVLLRGLGRLDVFPQNDSGVARSLAFVTGGKPVATGPVLEHLGAQRGMLYYHLLLARLEARGELAPVPRKH